MKVLDIIKTLVRKDENRSREDHLSELVPIDLVFRGYGFWGGKHPFKFDPHPDYKKKKPYEKIIDTDDNDKRCKGLSSINEDIDKYNEWISEKNRLSTELLLKTVQHPTIAIDKKDLNLAINTPSILRKFPYWRFVMVKASPKYRKLDKTNSHAEIDDKQLYLLKEKIPVGEFVKRFNKTIFDCLLKESQEAKKLDIWDSEHTWWHPVREFSMWFNINKQNHKDIESFILIKRKNKGGRPKGEGGRPKDPKIDKKRKELYKRYYHLTVNEGLTKRHAIKKLTQEFPWKKTTIEKYIK